LTTKIALSVLRLRIDAESEHGESDLESFTDAVALAAERPHAPLSRTAREW
jgi:hypothetical protein